MLVVRKIFSMVLVMAMLFSLSGCGGTEAGNNNTTPGEVPTLAVAYGNDLHTCLLNVAMSDTAAFADKAARINPVSENQFELLQDDQLIAQFNIITGKSGAECATMMGQGHLDITFSSNTAMLSAYDVGTNVKILSPLQSGGVSMVMGPENDFYGFDAIKKYIEDSPTPVKVGYHSVISGPRILIESILNDAGFKLTEDPGDTTADVLMVDLKGAQNLLPSIRSGAVDAWVGPSPNPENAEKNDMGKIVMRLDDFPPQGKWTNFPCCVMAATTEVVENHPEVIEALVSVVVDCIHYGNDNREKFAEINSAKIGVEKDVILANNIIYTSDPSQEWLDGIEIYFNAIQAMNKFTDRLKDADYETVKKEVFDFSFVEKANSR
jgi:NitT/TauT family transport system substrate-binding protein